MPFKVIKTETFDWTSPSGDCAISFRVTDMLRDIASGVLAHKAITTPIDYNWAGEWLPKREPDFDYAARIGERRAAEPVLGVWMPDACVLLIDGTHRYIWRCMASLETIDYHIVLDPAWRAYATITGALGAPLECPL